MNNNKPTDRACLRAACVLRDQAVEYTQSALQAKAEAEKLEREGGDHAAIDWLRDDARELEERAADLQSVITHLDLL